MEAEASQINQDLELAQKSGQFFKLIESKIAMKSFQGAQEILQTTYAMVLLGDDTISFLQSKISQAQRGFKDDGNRIFWQWNVILVFSTLSACHIVWKFGMLKQVASLLKSIFGIAKIIIGKSVYAVVGALGKSFKFLCSIIKDLMAVIG